MGRRKLEQHEKMSRVNDKKELMRQSKLSIKENPVDNLFQSICTKIEGTVPKSNRGRKIKQKQDDIIVDDSDAEINSNPEIIEYVTPTSKQKQLSVSKKEIVCIINRHANNSTELSNTAITQNDPWTEKYRPKNMKHILLDNCMRIKLETFITMQNLPNLLISGSSGTGKTSTIQCVAKKILGKNYHNTILELNASDNRGLEMITKLIDFCDKKVNGCLTIDEFQPATKIQKIIILDEADNITPKAQNILTNMMDKYKNTIRFCFTCNNSTKIIEQIQSRCVPLHYRQISKENMKSRLEYICEQENILYDDAGIEAIIFIAEGDIRSAINNMEAVYNSFQNITSDNVYKLCYHPHPVIMTTLLQQCVCKNLKEVLNNYDKLKQRGYCNCDIVQTMITVLKYVSIDEHIRINFIKILSDTYITLNEGLDTNLQLYSCFAKMIMYIVNQ